MQVDATPIREKRFLCISGPMGAGKTTVCRALQQRLDRCVFLDGDWCWDAHPFQVTGETKAMVLANITDVLNRFLACSVYDTVLFCWVMDRQSILDDVLSRLSLDDVKVCSFSLVCTEEALRARLERDVAAGRRSPDAIENGLARLPRYEALNTEKLDVSELSPEEAAEVICKRI
ncbi:MAG: AAA family ATPase [Oscillospiraceae bacterium]|nr:AAA family ATPase [Oscillospiraceae bacterium]